MKFSGLLEREKSCKPLCISSVFQQSCAVHFANIPSSLQFRDGFLLVSIKKMKMKKEIIISNDFAMIRPRDSRLKDIFVTLCVQELLKLTFRLSMLKNC